MAMITKTGILWECRAEIPIRIGIGMLQLAKALHRLSKSAHRLRFLPMWPLCCDRAKLLLQGIVVGSREGLRWNIRSQCKCQGGVESAGGLAAAPAMVGHLGLRAAVQRADIGCDDDLGHHIGQLAELRGQ